MRQSIVLLLLNFLSCVWAGYSDDVGFSYDRMPPRNRAPEVIRTTIAPRKPRPRPPDGGSRYLRRRKPGKKNMDKSLLRELMGDDFQASWMSDEKPERPQIPITSNDVSLDDLPGRWAADRIQAQSSNITEELSSILSPQNAAAVRDWLVQRSMCPVEFRWKDLGPTFWPRWVRSGHCMNRGGTCSFPPGMHCVPAATTSLTILHWTCRDKVKRKVRGLDNPRGKKERMEVLYRRKVPEENIEKLRRKRRKCDWNRVPYPVTIECFCTC